jgi:sugar lactone lactonase YvrE
MRRIAASVAISLIGALFAAGPASASSLYVVNGNDGSVSQYGVAADGALSPLSPAVVPAGPGHSSGIAITPDGGSAYVTNSASVSQYDIGPGGGLTPKSPASVPTSPGAEGVAVSPDGKSVYVGGDGKQGRRSIRRRPGRDAGAEGAADRARCRRSTLRRGQPGRQERLRGRRGQ